MKKRFSLLTVVGISALTAVAVAAVIAWTGNVKKGQGAHFASIDDSSQVRNASWLQSQTMSFADLAERVQSAVVNISTSKKIARPRMMTPFPQFGPRDPFEDFFEKFFEGMPKEQTQRSLGSGFIIDKDGTILTNNHVISQADEIEVQTSDNKKYKAKVVGVDEKTDLAVVRINADKDLPFVTLGSSKSLRPGEWVMAIGNPFGLEHTVTVGVVSAIGRAIGGGPYARFIQTDASINPGNSGGPLFNARGEVVGVNTMMYAGGQGIGFAIPIDLAKSLIPDLVEKGSVSRGWLGVAIQPITPELAKSFGLKEEKGALIAEVYQGSPAEKAGLIRGDVVVEYNGEKVDEPYDLSLFVGETKEGADAKLVVMRGSEKKDFTIKIGKQDAKQSRAEAGQPGPEGTGKADALGLAVRSISVEDARDLNVPADFKGVVVTRVEPGSAAEDADVRAGDVLAEVNNIKIASVDDYLTATKTLKKGDVIRLFIKRGKASIYLAFRM